MMASDSPIYSILDSLILDSIKDNPRITTQGLSEKLSKSTATVYRHLDEMLKSGKTERFGARRNGYWIVKD